MAWIILGLGILGLSVILLGSLCLAAQHEINETETTKGNEE